MLTLLSFLVVICVLIAVHEWGHYRMAVACGVKVLRFSIGFGKTLWSWKPKKPRPGQDTEFVIAAIPFGGYVKMLDEREGEVAPQERHRAFNTQPLRARALIVAAGPVANLALAAALYTLIGWVGIDEPRALLAPPAAGSLAQKAGLQAGDEVRRITLAGGGAQEVASFETVRWLLTQGAVDGVDVTLQISRDGAERQVQLPLSQLARREPDAQMFREIGIASPLRQPLIGSVLPGGAAEKAGLKEGDRVLRMGHVPVTDGQQLRELIRESGARGAPPAQEWLIDRHGQRLSLSVQPEPAQEQGQPIGRIGAMVGAAPEMTLVRYGPVQAAVKGVAKVWETSALTLRLMGRMVMGQISLRNISGPVAIAGYAEQAARLGPVYFLGLLAFVSVSLGVLNLLPLPVLDGGHLMYYLWEAVTGRPVTDAWMQRLQKGGAALLFAMMLLALYNDIASQGWLGLPSL